MNTKRNKDENTKQRELPEMTKEEAQEFCKTLAEDGVGKYIIATAQQDKATNLRIVNLNSKNDEPLLRLFAVTWDEVKEKGSYICKIEGFRVDKKNHIYMIIKPIHKLGDLHYKSIVWDFFLASGVLWKYYGTSRDDNDGKRMNVTRAYSMVKSQDDVDNMEKRKILFQDIIDGKLKMYDLHKALTMPDTYENAAMNARKRYEKGLPLPHLFKQRMDREDMNYKKLIEFFEAEHKAYEKLGLNSAKTLLDEAEAVMAYYKTLVRK